MKKLLLLLLVHRNEGAAAIDAARHHTFAWSKFAFTQRVHGRDCHA
ncbi:MAG: hypothetical protein Q8L15_11685 [Methylobacter sp.]|nr:hypothetical protein [Methylobacter sp.]